MSILQSLSERFRMYLQTLLDKQLAFRLQLLVTAIGVLIAGRVMYIQQGWINADSVLYFEAAKLFAAGLWKDGLALYGWPLYSLAIAFTHRLTHLDIESSAQLLNALFFGITTFSFISLIRTAGGSTTTTLSGAALLFSSTYIVGDVLPMLLRDQGFWAFFLTGIVFFIRFYRYGDFASGFLWQVSSLIAMLFRVEAITFLISLPLLLLFQKELPKQERLVRTIKASSLSLLAATLIIILISSNIAGHQHLGRLHEFTTAIDQITELFTARAELFGKYSLGKYLDDYAEIGLATSITVIVILKSIKCAGLLATGLALFGFFKTKSAIKYDAAVIFLSVISIALVNEFMIILHGYVLSGRYNIALAFIILIFASFGLAKTIELSKKSESNKTKWLLLCISSALTVSLIMSLASKSDHYAYEKEAVAWIKQNTPANRSIFYVSPRVRYYAGEPYSGRYYEFWDYITDAIKDGSIHNYDYLVISLNSSDAVKEQLLTKQLPHHVLIKEFSGKNKSKKILFFAKKSNDYQHQ